MNKFLSRRLVACLVLVLALLLAACTARSRGEDTPKPPPPVTLAPGQTLAPGETLPPPPDEGDGGDGGDDELSFDPEASFVEAPQLTIQLAQFPNARAAGFMMADIQGYYAEQAVEVLLNPAIPGDIDPIEAMLADQTEDGPPVPQFLFAPAALVMAANADGADSVNIAQVFQRSGQRIASMSSTPIADLSELSGGQVMVLPNGRADD